MSAFLDKLRAWNEEWKGLPRRLLTILMTIGGLLLLLLAFPYVAPFVLAALFARMIEPAVRLATRPFAKKRIARNIASAVFVALLVSTVVVLLFILAGRVIDELKTLAVALPDWVRTTSVSVNAWIDSIDFEWVYIDPGVEDAIVRLVNDLTSMLTSLGSRMASATARVAWRAASLLPQGMLYVVLTLMGTYYMISDKERILGFLKGMLPEKYRHRSDLFRAGVLRAVLGQLRVALIMMVVTFIELSGGFLLMGLPYAILFALIIAVVDALPVLGAGLFLIPMCMYGIVMGDPTFAIGGGGLYLLVIIVRGLLEPRFVGRQLGLYPLATMMTMYAGLKAMGVLGMLFGPVVLLLCKVALTADSDIPADASGRKPFFQWRKGQKKQREG